MRLTEIIHFLQEKETSAWMNTHYFHFCPKLEDFQSKTKYNKKPLQLDRQAINLTKKEPKKHTKSIQDIFD